MAYAICKLSIIPIRSSANNSSDMITQLLFGETAEIIEIKNKHWFKIKSAYDGIVGWASPKQFESITKNDFDAINLKSSIVLEYWHPAISDERQFYITIGAQLPDFDGLKFNVNGSQYLFSGQAITKSDRIKSGAFALKLANRFLNTPFLSGGRSALGIDSGGLVQMIYKIIGIKLPRNPDEQVYQGKLIHFIEEAKDGDLFFFENSRSTINHVGIYSEDKKIIHPDGYVKSDLVDHFGIFDKTLGRYTYKLRVIKRLIY
jgi:gamma-D-glutamyl-L-lysine dipeptidyl-peptidase